MSEPREHAISDQVHDAAGDWLERRQNGMTPDLERKFREWFEADPRHRAAYEAAERLWRNSTLLANSEVGRDRKLVRAPFLARQSTRAVAAGVAACVIFGLAGLGIVREISPSMLLSAAEASTYQTAKGEIRSIRLEDGSQVTLDTATTLHVDHSAGSRRFVMERGRARFSVGAGSSPIVVALPGGDTAAGDAVFDVSVTQQPPVVTAISGRVALRGPVARRPGDPRIVVAGRQSTPGIDAIDRPASLQQTQWTAGMLALDATPLGEAVAAINAYNDVEIRLADPRLARLSVSGAFRVRDPEAFARAVAAMFDLTIGHGGRSVLVLRRR